MFLGRKIDLLMLIFVMIIGSMGILEASSIYEEQLEYDETVPNTRVSQIDYEVGNNYYLVSGIGEIYEIKSDGANPASLRDNIASPQLAKNALSDPTTFDIFESQESSAIIWTDKADYSPGETVIVFGIGFLPDKTIEVNITRPNSDVDTGFTTSNSSGHFIYNYDLNGILGIYNVSATDGVNTAYTSFTDSTVDFKQYANKPDTNKWIGSALGTSNSEYREGMSVPQRLIFEKIATTSGNKHTLTFSVLATKGGVHAYDWLTGWNQGNDPLLGYDPCGVTFTHTTYEVCDLLQWKSGGEELLVEIPDDNFLSKDGLTQDRIDAYESVHENRFIRITGNSSITSAALTLSHSVSNGSDTGDSYIDYTLNWTSASDIIMIQLAGHLSLSGDSAVAWGENLGASYISGGPYHFKLSDLDSKPLGSQDNQIKSGSILPAEADISVDKTGPSTAQIGETITYTFNITNHGPSPAFDVNLTDNLLGPIDLSGLAGLTDEDGDNDLDDLAVNASVIVTVDYTIISGTDVVNTARVNSTTYDPDVTNNQDDHYVDVLGTAIFIDKTGPLTAEVGEQITYTINATNTGAVNLTMTTLFDSLLGDISGYSYLGDDGDGVFEPGESWIYSVTYTVQQGDPDPLFNSVTVEATNTD
ncbi:MAG: DUF7507 domain-containing protein, partial [Candidatus Kariarchaeaceae archaeon]